LDLLVGVPYDMPPYSWKWYFNTKVVENHCCQLLQSLFTQQHIPQTKTWLLSLFLTYLLSSNSPNVNILT